MAEKTLSVKLSLNDKQFQSALRKSTRSIQRFGKKMQSFGDTMTRNITLPVIGLGAAAVKLASDFEETQSKFNTVFKDISDNAQTASKELSDSFGLSSRASMQLLSDTGDLLTGFGFTQEEALKLSTEVNKLAVDLASFTNFSGGAEGASLALTKALLGERESIKSLGIAITEADLKQFAEDQGLVFKELGRVEKANLTFQLALKQSANAVGDFARTSDSFAGQLRILKGELENVAVELGVEILPLAKDLVGLLRDLAKFTSQFSSEQRTAALQVAGFAAVLGPIISVAGRLIKAFAGLRKFFLGSLIPALINVGRALVALTPQGKIIAGVILAAQGIYTYWNDLVTVFDNVKTSVEKLLEKLGLLKKEEDIALDFSIQDQSGQVFTIEELRRRTAAFKGTKIVPKKKPVQMSQEEREGRARMAKGKAEALALPSIEPIKAIKVELQSIPDVLDEISVSFSETFTKMEQMAMMVSSTFRNAFMSTADASEASHKEMIASAKNAAREQIKIALATAVAEQIKKILSTVPFPLNLAIAAGAGSIVGSLFAKTIPAFADGGIISGPTIGLMGEYAGARTNPEVIAPLDKLKSMIATNGGSTEVFGTISGADILLSSDRAKKNRNRTRGY